MIKADIGVRDGRIVALGKAGNPDIMDGVTPELVIGPSTEVIAGNGLILTAGGIDSHVHLIAPQQIPVALAAGMTTLTRRSCLRARASAVEKDPAGHSPLPLALKPRSTSTGLAPRGPPGHGPLALPGSVC